MARQPPGPDEIFDAAFARATRAAANVSPDLVAAFASKLGDTGGPSLAAALAALSGLTDLAPQRSLLTANPSDLTVRVTRNGSAVSPSEVTKLAKALGAGKLGRVTVLSDGSAVFDLVAPKAMRLVDDAALEEALLDGLSLELPRSLP